MEEKLSKSQAMSSMDNNIKTPSGDKDEYAALGHDVYFDKYQRFQGFTKEQLEICKREWDKDTFRKLFKRESSSIDKF